MRQTSSRVDGQCVGQFPKVFAATSSKIDLSCRWGHSVNWILQVYRMYLSIHFSEVWLEIPTFCKSTFSPLNRGRYVYDCCCILCLGDDIWNWIFVHSTYLVKTRIKIWVLRGDIESRSPRNVTNNDNGFREARYSPSVTLLCVMRRICGKCVFLCLPKKTPGVQKCSA